MTGRPLVCLDFTWIQSQAAAGMQPSIAVSYPGYLQLWVRVKATATFLYKIISWWTCAFRTFFPVTYFIILPTRLRNSEPGHKFLFVCLKVKVLAVQAECLYFRAFYSLLHKQVLPQRQVVGVTRSFRAVQGPLAISILELVVGVGKPGRDPGCRTTRQGTSPPPPILLITFLFLPAHFLFFLHPTPFPACSRQTWVTHYRIVKQTVDRKYG